MSNVAFLQRYKILNKIGEGSFSEVLKCQDLRFGSFLAAKKLKKRFNTWDEVNECAEVVAMHKLSKHPNILQMSEFHFDSFMGKVTFLFELMDMSLYDFINMRKKHVHESRAKFYLYQILRGLDHLHRNGMFHRDIKPENILLKLPIDEEYESVKYETIKIGDLGSLRGIYSTPPYTEYISTRWYRSPECLLTAGYYGPKMDIWATGCVFYELLTFKPLFAGSNEVDQLAKIHKIIGTPSKRMLLKFSSNKSCNFEYFPKTPGKGIEALVPNISTDGQNILKLMISYDPDTRSNVKRLLDQKYFKHMRESEANIRRPVSLEPIGDYNVSGCSSKKTPASSSQMIAQYDKKLKRSYNEIYNTKRMTPLEKLRKVEHKRPKRSFGDLETTAPKKFKLSDSYKNLVKETLEFEEPKICKKHKVVDSYKYISKETTEVKAPKVVHQKHCKPYESHNDNKSNSSSVRKYAKAKKDYEVFRKTTGNIPQIFSKHVEKTKAAPISKSFVEKKTVKYDPNSCNDKPKLHPRHPKIHVGDATMKTLKINKKN